ncbi:MAG TPA: DUF2934 domain-containing protein [Cellvibrio sp.]|nr:DUF2934 domain-containing protein [Cellvibrio sp.]
MSPYEKRVRELAYQIWESEGRPAGHEYRHWEMACKLVEMDAEPLNSRDTRNPLQMQPANEPGQPLLNAKKNPAQKAAVKSKNPSVKNATLAANGFK